MMKTTAYLPLAAALMLGVAGPAAFDAAPAHAQSSADSKMFTLQSVTFEGNSRVSTDTLNSVVGLTPGQKVNRDSIVEAFNKVVAEYNKENVGGSIQPTMRTQGSKMSVVFKITEAAPPTTTVVQPILDHETFTGNQKVSSDKLQSALTMTPGKPVTKDMVLADETALGNVYKAAKVAVTISPKVTNLPQAHVDINFEIVEGKAKHAE